jgi:hypothetical protein
VFESARLFAELAASCQSLIAWFVIPRGREQSVDEDKDFDWAAQDEMNIESHNNKTFLVELLQNDFNNVEFFPLVM